jgi:hypothetical protein
MDQVHNTGAGHATEGLLGSVAPGTADLAPDFLIISPSKTGSTWLTVNLQNHPQVFIPSIKEVNYFSFFHRHLGLDWYFGVFRPGAHRVKGDASPCYAALPMRTIHHIRTLFPNIKLIYLMRDPIGRAWSHAKHNFKYGEANFRRCRESIDQVPEAMWLENFRHPWPVSHGDYLGQLQRWTAVFPREQLFVGFFEQIVADPRSLLLDIFAFLGLQPEADLTGYPLHAKILEGASKQLPSAMRVHLHTLHAGRTRQLADYLQDTFQLSCPSEWSDSLTSNAGAQTTPRTALVEQKWEDDYLASLLELNPPVRPTLIEEGFCAHNLIWHKGRFFALSQRLGSVDAYALIEGDLQRGTHRDEFLTAPTLVELRDLVRRSVTPWVRIVSLVRSLIRWSTCGKSTFHEGIRLRDCRRRRPIPKPL